MNKIVDFYNKVRKDKRMSTLAVSVLGVCLAFVVIIFICMPELQAAAPKKNTVSWSQESENTYSLGSLEDGDLSKYTDVEIDVNTGNEYTIKGEDTTVRKNLHITLNYKGAAGTKDNPAVVNVVLDNVNITQLSDISAISLVTSTNAVKFNLIIKGSCTIKSQCADATKALIAVESVEYEFLKLKQGDDVNIDTYVETIKAGNEVSLILKGDTSESELTLQNAAGSMGALIGSSEVNASVGQSNQMLMAIEAYYNSIASGGQIYATNVVVQSQLIEMGFTPLDGEQNTFMPQYKCKNASGFATGDIIIGGETGSEAPLRLNLSNSGYGASVGSGGSKDTSRKACDAKSIIINSGTITVYDNRTDCSSPIFGSGIAKGAANVSNTYGKVKEVQINGGSVYFGAAKNRFGGITNGVPLPCNNLGKQVYQVEAYTRNDTTGISIANIADMGHGEVLPVKYKYDSSLVFVKDPESITDSSVNGEGAVNLLDVKVKFSDTNQYKYSGTGHRSSSGATYYSLYFFLPAVQTTTLTISDEFGPGVVNFTLKEQGSMDVVEPLNNTDPTSDNSRIYLLERNKVYYLTADNVPEGLSIAGVKLTKDGKESNADYTASGYAIGTDTAAINATVTYGGTIPIVYDTGLVAGDEGNHDIVMPTVSYEYGTSSFEIPHPVVNSQDDLYFDGWVCTDEYGNEITYLTHIISGTDIDPYKKSYSDVVRSGKIYLKAKWKIWIKYDIGDNATMPNGEAADMIADYGAGTDHVIDFKLTNKVPQKELFAFTGWTLDGGTTLYNYSQGSTNIVQLSTLTSHVFSANYDRSGFGVYIDASTLNELYADLSCTDNGGNPILVKDGERLATVVKDGKTYYYTSIVRKDATARVSIKAKTGYRISNFSVRIDGAAAVNTSSDGSTEWYADITVGQSDIFVSTEASFSPVEYRVTFKDGKNPNEYLWGGYTFTYSVEDIADGKTIGDIIRRGLGKTSSEMSDNDIALSLNAIDKNTRFTDFSGWLLPFNQSVLSMDKTIASIFAENGALLYGNMEFTAGWTEYDKYAIDVTLLERVYNDEGFYKDVVTDKLMPVLQYYAEGSTTRVPVYTEEVKDPVTGERKTVAYAKAGDRIVISLYRMDSHGNPVGEPVTSGINIETLYYEYNSKLNEQVHVDVKDGSQTFTVKNDVKDDTVINVCMAFTAKQFNIVYWDLKQHDNSANPRTYTIFDEFDFAPIATGVNWLLVCQDIDDTNDDEVTTEVITGIRQDGKLLTDGAAAERNYASNLVLKPDWGDEEAESFSISIALDNSEFGNVSIIYPTNSGEFFENDTIILSVVPKDGYQLVPNSLVYRKNEVQTFSLTRRRNLMAMENDTFIILPIDVVNGTYILTMPNSDIVISALFELCEYSITYSDVPSDVENDNPESYNLYSEITLSELSREGYKFLGWFDADGNRIVKITGRTGNVVLTPQFELLDTPNDGPNGGNTEEPTTPDNGNIEEPTTPDGGNTEEPTTPDNGNIEEPTTPGGGNSGNTDNSNDKGDADNGGLSDNSKPNNVTISGRPSNVVQRPSETISYGNVQTGDKTNVPRLVLICIAAVLVLMIVVIKKPGNKDE